MVKITYKGETRDIPKRYIPDSLSPADRKKQIKSIFEGKKRPEVKYKEKRSKWVIQFENKYGTTIMDDKFIHKNIISKTGKDKWTIEFFKSMADQFGLSGTGIKKKPFKRVTNVEGKMLYSILKKYLGI